MMQRWKSLIFNVRKSILKWFMFQPAMFTRVGNLKNNGKKNGQAETNVTC